MTLERVSFKNGRKHEPRLSKPYEPGKRNERYRTEAEDKILRDHYPTKGLSYCLDKLPGRTVSALQGHLGKLGIKLARKEARKKRSADEFAELDAKITSLWPTLEIPRGAVSGVKELARQLGEPHWLITQRCRKLGPTRPRRKEPNWTSAEEELMRHVPLHDVEKCAEIFKAHGFNRSATAIMVKAKHLNISRRYSAGFSARTAAEILGLDH
jgi:hypothetical protein